MIKRGGGATDAEEMELRDQRRNLRRPAKVASLLVPSCERDDEYVVEIVPFIQEVESKQSDQSFFHFNRCHRSKYVRSSLQSTFVAELKLTNKIKQIKMPIHQF